MFGFAHNGHRALTDQHDGHRVAAHALARDAAGGVGRIQEGLGMSPSVMASRSRARSRTLRLLLKRSRLSTTRHKAASYRLRSGSAYLTPRYVAQSRRNSLRRVESARVSTDRSNGINCSQRGRNDNIRRPASNDDSATAIGCLARLMDGHRMGAEAVARDAAGGVGGVKQVVSKLATSREPLNGH